MTLSTIMDMIDERQPGVKQAIIETVKTLEDAMELLNLYFFDDGGRPLAASLKRWLAKAVEQMSPETLAAYNPEVEANATIRDLLRLVHPKPRSPEQARVLRSLIYL